jgi:hypothetical protein
MSNYQEELHKQLKYNQDKLARAKKAKQFKDSSSVAIDVLNLKISLALNAAFGVKPLSYEEYLSKHGEVAGLRSFMSELESDISQEESLNNVIKQQDEQLQELRKK